MSTTAHSSATEAAVPLETDVQAGTGVAPGRLGEGVLVTLADRALQVPGLVTELLEAGFGGQVGHDGSFRAPAVRVASRKE
jgi:hypothetical protein